MASSIVPVDPTVENRRTLQGVLDFYEVSTVEELNAETGRDFWSEKLWQTWQWTFRDWGCSSQTFDMTQPKDGLFRVIEHFTGERRFFFDEKEGEISHEKRYQKESGEEYKQYYLPKSVALFDDGLAVTPEGPMFANIRLLGFPPCGHGTYGPNKLAWGAPAISVIALQPDTQVRVSVMLIFLTPSTPGAKGPLLKINIFRDDITGKPFSKSLHWINSGGDATIKKIDYEQAVKSLFPFAGIKGVTGFGMRSILEGGCPVRVTDGLEFTKEVLAEGGEEAQYFALPQSMVVQVIQVPEQGKSYAFKWRLMWRLAKRLMVGVYTYNAETLAPEPEIHEYAYEL